MSNQPETTPPREWKENPYTVEVDDHSDDCGTVYKLTGPNVGILSKDEEYLKERAEDFNLGFEMGRRAQEAERDLTPEEAFAEAQKRWGEYATVKDHGRMFYQGRKITEDDFAVGDCTGVIFHSNKSYRAAFASADKAEAEREKK